MEVREIFDLQNKYRKKRIIFAIIFLIVIVLLTLIFINLNSIVAYFDKKSPYLDSKQLIYYDKDKNSVLIKFFVNDNVNFYFRTYI